jgi:hypothetical protein
MFDIKHNSSDDEKRIHQDVGNGLVDTHYGDVEDPLEENEVFKKTHDGVDFRTVGWPRACVIFLKGQFEARRYTLEVLTKE